MAKKMRVRSGGKHKVMSALAAASGLGNLAGRGRKSHGHKGFRYEVELKPKDLLSTDKLVALAVAKAAIDQLRTGSGENLSSDERREIERAVSALVSGKKYVPSTSVELGFALSYNPDPAKFGKAQLVIGKKGAAQGTVIGSRDAFDSLTVCPNKFNYTDPANTDGKKGDLGPKARAAGRFAAQAMYNLLDTGLITRKRKVYKRNDDGTVKESVRLFLGPDSSSKEAKMELPSPICYRIKIDKALQQKAAANMLLTQTASASSAVTSRVAEVINDFRSGAASAFPSRKRASYGEVEETDALAGLGQLDDVEESEVLTLDGMRRRRKSRKSRKSAARKSPARRRKSSSKRKASRRRKK